MLLSIFTIQSDNLELYFLWIFHNKNII